MQANILALLLMAFLGSCGGLTPEDQVISQVVRLAGRTDLTDAEAVGRVLNARFRLVREGSALSPPEPDDCASPGAIVHPIPLAFREYEASAPNAGQWGRLRLRIVECNRGSTMKAELEGSALIEAGCIDLSSLRPEFRRHATVDQIYATPPTDSWVVYGGGGYAGLGRGGPEAWYGLGRQAWNCADRIVARQHRPVADRLGEAR